MNFSGGFAKSGVASALRKFFSLLMFTWLSMAMLCEQVLAQDNGKPLIFAGFAFSGDFQNRAQLYPHTAAISEEGDKTYLDKLLLAKLQQHPAAMQRVSLALSDGKQDVSSVAFALVQDDVETQRIDGKYWVIVSLQANVLVFNKATRTVVACYPLRMRFSRVQDSAPGAVEMRNLVREAYTTANPAENIFDQWLARLEKVQIREGARKYLRVTDVTLTPEAEKVIADAGRTSSSVRNQVANLLEVAVAERAGISIVPNSVGEVIGKNIAFRFANSMELQLVLPEPDYALTFAVRDFVSKKIEKPEYFQDIYRVKAAVAIRQPDSQRVVIDENVYDTLIVTRPRRADVQLADWNQYYKALQSLISGVSKEMVTVEDGWLKDNAARGTDARQGFSNAKQLLKDLM